MGYLHLEKNQNPTLLKALLKKNITAYAYEEIRDAQNNRLISQGFEAGVVGMFEGLRTYGKILEKQNLTNPFKNIKSIQEYKSKTEAYLALREIDPRNFTAQIYIAGYGKVSKGTQEVLAQLSHPPIILKEEDTDRKITEGTKNSGQESLQVPRYISNADILVNAIVWLPGQERIITKKDLEFMPDNSLIIDISCDAAGGIETCQPTTWDNPTYELRTNNNKTVTHFCVDNLPAAMANESSSVLSRMILPFVLKVANKETLERGMMTTEGKIIFTQKI